MTKGLVQSSLNIYVMMLQRQLCHGSSGLINRLIPCWVARGTALLGGGKRWRTDRSRGHWRWGLGWGGIMGLCLIWLFVSFSYFTSVNHMVLSETQNHGPWTVRSATSQSRYFFPSILLVRYFGHSLTKITDSVLIFTRRSWGTGSLSWCERQC